MAEKRLVTPAVVQPNALDHEREFVDIVASEAPALYRDWRASGHFDEALKADNAFNHGKLFAYAEWCVFRREFLHRFPEASDAAAINAFCQLFLKNDISISALVEFAEEVEDGRDRLPGIKM